VSWNLENDFDAPVICGDCQRAGFVKNHSFGATTRSRPGSTPYNHGGRFAPSFAAATIASEQIRMSRAKPPRGAEDALDILFCSEKGWPLPSTASPNAFMSFDSDHIAVLALAAVVIARIK
jgi:hypothetical protein